MAQVTDADLENAIERLNKISDMPVTPFSRDRTGKFVPNVGNYHLYQAYGSSALHQMHKSGDSSTDIIFHLTTRDELLAQIQSRTDGVYTRLLVQSMEMEGLL
jgi:hypothetical protein